MENQYNYYHSEEPQNDSSYSSQPNPEHHEKPKKKMPKAVVVTGWLTSLRESDRCI